MLSSFWSSFAVGALGSGLVCGHVLRTYHKKNAAMDKQQRQTWIEDETKLLQERFEREKVSDLLMTKHEGFQHLFKPPYIFGKQTRLNSGRKVSFELELE